jgi:hypothetical protein
LDFDSAHLNKYSINKDPYELFVFNAKTEKNPDLKYLSVWIYQDRNYLSGLVITKENHLNLKNKLNFTLQEYYQRSFVNFGKNMFAVFVINFPSPIIKPVPCVSFSLVLVCPFSLKTIL